MLTAGLEGGVASLQEPTFDLVLVDGRARLACALYVMRYLTDDSVVVIHDLMPRIMNADAASKLGKVSSRVLNTPEFLRQRIRQSRAFPVFGGTETFVEECGVGMSDESSVCSWTCCSSTTTSSATRGPSPPSAASLVCCPLTVSGVSMSHTTKRPSTNA